MTRAWKREAESLPMEAFQAKRGRSRYTSSTPVAQDSENSRQDPRPVRHREKQSLREQDPPAAARPATPARPTSTAVVMALIEVPLDSYLYHFRSLTWEEELTLSFPSGESPQRVSLPQPSRTCPACRSPGTMPSVSSSNFLTSWVLRVWQQYRADLPASRYYSISALYQAPEAVIVQRRMEADEEARDQVAEQAHALMAGQDDVSKAMFRNARASGSLVTAKEEGRG